MHNFKETSDLSIQFNNLHLVDSKESIIQNIVIYQHPLLGRILILNDEVHHVENWAPLYHEMIVHVPAAFIPKVEQVLILGGGSLFAAKEVLKYKSVKKVILIEHDSTIVELVIKNYPHAEKIINDERFELRIQDAFDCIRNKKERYDLVINDSVDLIEHGHRLKRNLIYQLSEKLNVDGITSDVVYRHIFERTSTIKTLNILNKKFKSTFSLIAVPEYPGIFHVLCLWSNSNNYLVGKKVVNIEQKKWIKIKSPPCEFYNPKFIKFYIYFPKYLSNILMDNNYNR